MDVSGLLLCQVGQDRLAFACGEVARVEPAAQEFPAAHRAFLLEGKGEKAVVSEAGTGVSVDALEVVREQLSMLPAPSLLLRGAGGSLRGFVRAFDQLWPVVDLAAFAYFLGARSEE